MDISRLYEIDEAYEKAKENKKSLINEVKEELYYYDKRMYNEVGTFISQEYRNILHDIFEGDDEKRYHFERFTVYDYDRIAFLYDLAKMYLKDEETA